MVQRIYLIGFMGAGKSTVGRELSLQLKWPLFDMDAEIEKAENSTVAGIFARFGESHFRELEREHLARLSTVPKGVIALGGGAFVDAENRKRIEATGVAVWLDASLSSIRERVRPDGSRPLLSAAEQLEKLYETRLSFYRLAPVHVLTDDRLPDAIAREIIGKVAMS